MRIKFKNLLSSSSILSAPGFISIFISLLSVPIHLNYAGPENYGNYIIFHFVLMISINFNLGVGKSVVISINNFANKARQISYEAILYTKNISIIIILFFLLFIILKNFFEYNFLNFYEFISYLFLGSIITVFFLTFEGILQGNRKFKIISISNLLFFSLSVSLPSILLAYDKSLTLEDLIRISIFIKFFSVIIMFLMIKNNNLYKKSEEQILLKNLKKNSKWITLNSILVQFYDLFDKYLIKFFLGPVAVATYSIPQQLAGKLSVVSKSFSAFLLPDLSKKKFDNQNFDFSLMIFMNIIPIIIFLLFPLYPSILKFWLGDSYNDAIHYLTKVFSMSVIFSCTSHILITKFEATKTLHKNLKIEFVLMPIFLSFLYFMTKTGYSLLQISFLILFKEFILLFLRFNLLKKEIKSVGKYYFFSILFLLILYLSFYNENLFYSSLIFLVLSFFLKNND